MRIVTILWHPNDRWAALGEREQADYLRSLDGPIGAARSAGIIVLGWSRVDDSLPLSPAGAFVGVFGVRDEAQAVVFERAVEQARWYEYFDSTNISVELEGANEGEPHRIYAKLLGVGVD